MPSISIRVLVSLACLLAPAALCAQASIRLGSEFRANSFTSGRQFDAAVAVDPAGDFVVVWESLDQDGADYGVFARRFNSAGVPQAAEFQVNAYTTDRQNNPAAAFLPDGSFGVVWQSQAQDGSGFGIFGRGFESDGTPVTDELQINSFTQNSQLAPALAFAPSGAFVVAWQSALQDGDSFGIFARRFDSEGTPLADDFQVNTYTVSGQAAPSLAFEADGDFVIAWDSGGQDGSNAGVFARRFSAAGVPQAVELQVNTNTLDFQGNPKVAVDDAGDFLVVWESQNQDGGGFGVFAQRFGADGAPQASEFQVNRHTAQNQRSPAVAIDGGGRYIVSWHSFQQDGLNFGVFGRHFDTAGVAQATEFQINSYTTDAQRNPAVAMNGEGTFVVAWGSYTQDGSNYGVFAQRFAMPAVLDIDGNGATAALTDGLLVLRYLFGFTGTTLTTGAVDTGACTRCNAAAIQAYLQTLI